MFPVSQAPLKYPGCLAIKAKSGKVQLLFRLLAVGTVNNTRLPPHSAAFIAPLLWETLPRLMLNCHVKDLQSDKPKSAQTVQNASERARHPWRPLMCVGGEASVSTFKRFSPISPSFHSISIEASRCQDLHFLRMALAFGEESVGLRSRFTGVVNLTAC